MKKPLLNWDKDSILILESVTGLEFVEITFGTEEDVVRKVSDGTIIPNSKIFGPVPQQRFAAIIRLTKRGPCMLFDPFMGNFKIKPEKLLPLIKSEVFYNEASKILRERI